MIKLRYGLGLLAGKGAKLVIRALGRTGSHTPGAISAKLDPKFLDHLAKPDQILAVTGTNGKTTTANLILALLGGKNQVVNNSQGSNIGAGIVTALMDNLTLTGKKRKNLAVLEVDEIWSSHIFPKIQPDFICITNLFQDSIPRNAHTDYIADRIQQGIPAKAKLILNGDDLISSRLAPDNDRVYYSVAPLAGEVQRRDSRLRDVRHCPNCQGELTWDFLRYHHIGQAHCEKCGFKSPEAKYQAVAADFDHHEMVVVEGADRVSLRLAVASLEMVYNQLAAYASLREMGYAKERIVEGMAKLKVVASRYDQVEAAGHKIYTISAKRMNPIANSRVFDMVSQMPGDKTVILCNDGTLTENIAWLYDADFEYLNQDNIKRLIISSWKNQDMALRALMAGIPEDKIRTVTQLSEAAGLVDLEKGGDVFILHDIADASTEKARQLRKELVRRWEDK